MHPRTMRRLRQIHLYVGLFLAPAILLFALSGALQTFRLQEEKGYGGTPPGWIVWMASVHKDSMLPRAKPADAGKAAAPKPPAAAKAPPAGGKRPSKLPMQIFATLMAIGLMVSASLGIAIALANRATRRVSIMMLVAGTAVPLILLLV